MTPSVSLKALALAIAAIPSFSPAFYAAGPPVPASQLSQGIEASISVPTGQPGATEYAWLMAWSATRRHFTQIGWAAAPGQEPHRFSYTAWPGSQWTEPNVPIAYSGRYSTGPAVRGSITVRIVPVSGTPADARRWYADEVLVGSRWVTMDRYPLTDAVFAAYVESYGGRVLVACFRFAAGLPSSCAG